MSSLKQRLDSDVKQAMLAGDALRLDTLRGLKSVILYAEVAAGKREQGLADDEIETLFAKEAKKRQESADLYLQGGSPERAEKELAEKSIIESYLPERLDDEALGVIIDEVIAAQGPVTPQAMGAIIGAVKQRVGNTADGGTIAKLVKEKIQ